MNSTIHRGSFDTTEKYRGVPVHAFPGVHETVASLLERNLPPGAKIADLGAGHGALSLRLQDHGFDVTAFDLDRSDWQAKSVECHQCDFNAPLDPIVARGPFDAICVLEVIDHLENPRQFLRELLRLRMATGSLLVLTMPNPLDTFSCIAMVTRGVFSWAGPLQYEGGGHISVLPHWLVDGHLKSLGVNQSTWRFLAPYRHPSAGKRAIYRGLSIMRRLIARVDDPSFVEGQTAMLVASI